MKTEAAPKPEDNERQPNTFAITGVVEKAVLLFFLLLGIGVLVKVRDFPYPLFRNIGTSPGIFPWLLGVLLIGLSSLQLLLGLIRKLKGRRVAYGLSEFGSSKPAVVVLASLLYTLVLPYAGYLLATAVWTVGLFVIFRPRSRIVAPAALALFIVLTYLVFQLYLPVRLPAGLLFR